MPRFVQSFRARLLFLLAVLLGLTLGVQYYVNLRSVSSNAHLIVEQEQAIMAGVALGVNSLRSNKYLDQMKDSVKQPLLDEHSGRVTNILVVDSDGNVQDSLSKAYSPQRRDDGSDVYVQLRDVPLPPLSSAVEMVDEGQPLPTWLAASKTGQAGEPGAFYFPIETNKGRWYIIVVLGSAQTLKDILKQQASRSAFYTLVLLLITTLLTGYLVWRFTRPIKDLSDAARRVAGGDFRYRVFSDRRDEMGSLASDFNEMTAKLERTRELESKLHQAEKAAMVGRLAAAIAHEIRNPLNYINLTLDHLRSSFAPDDEPRREKFERLALQLKTEVGRINRHITDFLKYSRPSALELQPTNLRSEVEDVLRIISVQASECGINTHLEQKGEVPTVMADRESLRSMLTNLLINGMQAIDGQGGDLTVTLTTDSSASAQVEIADTGHGIAPEDISKVFEPYYSTKETGTGLGLAIVKKAIDDHGGTIRVNSKLGSGTTFTITLPAIGKEQGESGGELAGQ
ncbi:MAG TPA: ATP-binding protein [Pyrinomonadaceae bacterium]|nr:ATP-binding protein [Pyrinomonadaceae bacterium]